LKRESDSAAKKRKGGGGEAGPLAKSARFAEERGNSPTMKKRGEKKAPLQYGVLNCKPRKEGKKNGLKK